jgi:sialic acid synthase SpsE
MLKFIAEVSSNHNKDLARAYDFIDASAKAGCDAVKFQLFRLDKLFAPEILERSQSHRRRQDWELPLSFIPDLAKYCQSVNLEFCCTPFYLDAVGELEPYVNYFKIASYELLWGDLLASCAQTKKPVILSTGMATMPEIERAVEILRSNGCTQITLLHCTSAYPSPCEHANLAAIQTIRDQTGCPVGWSDHTVEPGVIHRAVHRWGARTIEFHLDLDGNGEEFAAGHCWLPDQISEVILDVNKAFAADGNGVKEPVPSELSDRVWRADPSDGLRPLKEIRATWSPIQ